MPCNCDYMEPTRLEVELSNVAALLEELAGFSDWKRHYNRGSHPRVYNKHLTKAEQDSLVAGLCAELHKVDVTKYSLEMQIWWRDHQAADAKRLKQARGGA